MEIDGCEVMSVKAYAEKIGGKVSTIRKMCADCVLPSVKIGVPWFVFVDEADAYFRQQWLDKKAAKERRMVVERAPKGNGGDYLERLAELRREVLSI